MFIRYLSAIFVTILISSTAFAQRPPRQPGMPMAGGPPPMRDWVKDFDSNMDGKIDSTEFRSAIDSSFAEFDKNGNGSIDPGEVKRPRHDGRPMPPMGQGVRPPGPPMGLPPEPRMMPDAKKILPPFFFADRIADGVSTSKAEFEKIARGVFNEMDKNRDGFITLEESHPPQQPGDGPKGAGGPPPNARFIAAEMRFGDKLVKGQPFSAETVIEDTRRLFDGTTVKKEMRGAIYRDGEGRTRREQPLDVVDRFSISDNDTKRIMLIFISDFPGKSQYSLDLNNKTARKSPIWSNNWPFPETDGPREAKTESLGAQTFEGVSAEGTRTTFEIPEGQIGNTKPIQVISEKWFSPELQVVVMSRHVDPIAGEHLFKLVNIKRGEPSAELFTIPAGFRVENAEPKKDRM